MSLIFEDEPVVYDGSRIHRGNRGAELVARHEATGQVGELPILRVVLANGGCWKLTHDDE